MLYSQTCYLGCFLPIPGNDITEMQNLITDFVVDRLKVGKKRFFLSPGEGGLGLFELKTFLESQKCAWIKRSANLDEIWKIKIYVKSLGSVYNVRLLRYDKETEPIIYEIVRCFEKFYSEFIKKKMEIIYMQKCLKTVVWLLGYKTIGIWTGCFSALEFMPETNES